MLEYSGGRRIRRKNQILDTFLRGNQGKEKEPKVSTFPAWRAIWMMKADCDRCSSPYFKNKERPHKVKSLFRETETGKSH